MIKLSVCIPTYNHAKFLGEALDSILSQATDEVEIVISDNASTDNTEDLVKQYQEKYKCIRYFRSPQNLGPNVNFLKVVSLASGEYCWLLGSDDALEQGAITRILEEIKSKNEIYLFNRTDCNAVLEPRRKKTWLRGYISEGYYDFSNDKQALNYFSDVQYLGGLFSFISCMVFKRDNWMSIECDQEAIHGTAYPHAFVLLSMVHEGCRLKYFRDSLVLCRLGAEEVVEKNAFVTRFLLDVEGIPCLANKIFADKPQIRRAVLHALHQEHPWRNIIRIRKRMDTWQKWQEMREKLIIAGYDSFILNLFNYYPIAFIVGNLIRLWNFAIIKPSSYFSWKLFRQN